MEAPRRYFEASYVEYTYGHKSRSRYIWDGSEVWQLCYVFPDDRPNEVRRANRPETGAGLAFKDLRWCLGARLLTDSKQGIWDLIDGQNTLSARVGENGSRVSAVIVNPADPRRHEVTLATDPTGRLLRYRLVDNEWLSSVLENLSFALHEGIWYPVESRFTIQDKHERRIEGHVLPPGDFSFVIRFSDLHLQPDFATELSAIKQAARDPEIIFHDSMEPKKSRQPEAALRRQNEAAQRYRELTGEGGAPLSSSTPAVGAVPIAATSSSGIETYVWLAACGAAVCLVLAILLLRKQRSAA